MQPDPQHLSDKFSVPGLQFETGNGGLTKAVVQTALSSGELYLYGAHVSAFAPHGQTQVLWVSDQSHFAEGKPIRGGIPVCFPWFGGKADDSSAPAHGLARTKTWDLISANADAEGGVLLTMASQIDQFQVSFAVGFGETLQLSMRVELPQQAAAAASFEQALHSYFAISDIDKIEISGLESTAFLDKVDGGKRKPASGQPLKFDGQCDRVYLETAANCVLRDPGWGRTIEVSKTDSKSTVVWNPWIEKSTQMADFGDDEWKQMVCIETANVSSDAIQLRPGQSHTMTATIAVAKL